MNNNNNNNTENNTLKEINDKYNNKKILIISTIIIAFFCMVTVSYNIMNRNITLVVNGKENEINTFKYSVGEAIKEKDIDFDKDDFINIKYNGKLIEQASLDTKLKDDMYIELISVSTEVLSEYKDIEFDTKVEEDADLLKGERKVSQDGENGKNRLDYNAVYHNGKLVSKQFLKEVVIKNPIDKIVKKRVKVEEEILVAESKVAGAKSSNSSTKDTSSKEVEVANTNTDGKHMKVVATAYSGDGITATGTVPKWGTIAVDPKIIPYGTKVYIPQFNKTFIAEDCGGAIKGNKIDIYMNSKDSAYSWGRRSIDIYILG